MAGGSQGRNFISLWEGPGPQMLVRKGVKSEEKSDFVRIWMVPERFSSSAQPPPPNRFGKVTPVEVANETDL